MSSYIFSNWNTTSGGIGISYDPGDTFVISEDTNLYAQWVTQYDLNYIANTGNNSNTVLLLNCDGSVASTTFIDTSAGAMDNIITAYGSAQVIADGKFGQCCDFDGVDSYLRVTENTPGTLRLGSGDFCIDFWIKFNTSPSANNAIFSSAVDIGEYTDCYFSSSSNLRWRNDTYTLNANWTPTPGIYYHLAFVRESTWGGIYIDGVRLAYGQFSGAIDINLLNIGKHRDDLLGTERFIDAQIDEFRISKDAARINDTGDPLYRPIDIFTPPSVSYDTSNRGSISGNNTQQIISGADATTVTAIASSGYIFTQWDDGNTNAVRTDTNIIVDATHYASFATI